MSSYEKQHFGVVPPTGEAPRFSTPENLAKRINLNTGLFSAGEVCFCSDIPLLVDLSTEKPKFVVNPGQTYTVHIALNSDVPLTLSEQHKFPFVVNVKSPSIVGSIVGAYNPYRKYVSGTPQISLDISREASSPKILGAEFQLQTESLGSLQSAPSWYNTLLIFSFSVVPEAPDGEESTEYDEGGYPSVDVLKSPVESFYIVR